MSTHKFISVLTWMTTITEESRLTAETEPRVVVKILASEKLKHTYKSNVIIGYFCMNLPNHLWQNEIDYLNSVTIDNSRMISCRLKYWWRYHDVYLGLSLSILKSLDHLFHVNPISCFIPIAFSCVIGTQHEKNDIVNSVYSLLVIGFCDVWSI